MGTNKNVRSLTICFLGPDGSGKSTIISELLKQPLPFGSHNYFHLKPIRQKNEDNNLVVKDPHKLDPYTPVKSYLKLMYFIYQYNAGWYKNIFPLRFKSTLVIFDRYYDDLLADQKRYRYGGNIHMLKLVRYLIPKPDIYFVLTAEPKVIYRRKQEVPFEELAQQIDRYRNLVDNRRYVHVAADRTPLEIAQEVLCLIKKCLNEKK